MLELLSRLQSISISFRLLGYYYLCNCMNCKVVAAAQEENSPSQSLFVFLGSTNYARIAWNCIVGAAARRTKVLLLVSELKVEQKLVVVCILALSFL